MTIRRFPRSRQSTIPYPATLDLSFLGRDTLDPRVTFTRADATTCATYFDSAGVLRTAAANVPRFDYNPSTLAAQGFLVGEARTNSIRNNTMVGAVAGTPGTAPTNWTITSSGTGITQQIIGTGTEDGITYIDVKFSGTGSGTPVPQISTETSTQIVAASGQTWTASYYLRIVGGSTTGCTGTFQQIWQERDASGTSLNTVAVIIVDPTTAALKTQRSILTRTLTDAGTARLTNRIQWTFTNGVAVDITLRIGLPQLEQGAFATSVIPTTTVALTRAADVASVNTLSPWYNASAGTLYTEVTAPQNFANFPTQASFHDGGSTNIMVSNFNTGGAPRYERIAASVVGTVLNASPVIAAGGLLKQAIAYAANDFALCANAGTVGTVATGNVPTVNTLRLGGYVTGNNNLLNGYLRRVVYYPVRLSNADLQAITT